MEQFVQIINMKVNVIGMSTKQVNVYGLITNVKKEIAKL